MIKMYRFGLTPKFITVEDRERLKNSAQSITPKAGLGIDAVLRELEHYVGRTGQKLRPPETSDLYREE